MRTGRGFFKTQDQIQHGPLVIIYHQDLTETQKKVQQARGQISKDTFSFPGGSRFHFLDPSGNDLAVWSDQ